MVNLIERNLSTSKKSVCLDTDDQEGILKMVVFMWIMTLQSYCGGWRRMWASMRDSVFGGMGKYQRRE